MGAFPRGKALRQRRKVLYYPRHPAADHALLALLVWWVLRNILKI